VQCGKRFWLTSVGSKGIQHNFGDAENLTLDILSDLGWSIIDSSHLRL
jgi:hypothetical protein